MNEESSPLQRPPVTRPTGRANFLTEVKNRYLAAILVGAEAQAFSVLEEATQSGVTVKNIYLHVLMPAQSDLGELWVSNKISIGDEHVASQITSAMMVRLRSKIQPKPPLGKSIAVTSLSGDLHKIGAQAFADFLQMDGWGVHFLGVDTPADEILRYVDQKKIDVAGLSLSLPEVLDEAQSVVRLLKSLPHKPYVVLGGRLACTMPDALSTLGADGSACDAQEALQLVRRLVGLPTTGVTLEQFLKGLGSRLQKCRKEQRMSQQQLADTSGLDRAYISAVEHGKHNLTLGAVMRLAEALGISMDELLTEAQ